MPAGDRTGSMGQGPRTGRGLGYCSGFARPGYVYEPGGGISRGSGFGRGMGFGRGSVRCSGFGRGWGLQAAPWTSPMNKEDEIRLLKSEADALKRSQNEIEKRIVELNKEKD